MVEVVELELVELLSAAVEELLEEEELLPLELVEIPPMVVLVLLEVPEFEELVAVVTELDVLALVELFVAIVVLSVDAGDKLLPLPLQPDIIRLNDKILARVSALLFMGFPRKVIVS